MKEVSKCYNGPWSYRIWPHLCMAPLLMAVTLMTALYMVRLSTAKLEFYHIKAYGHTTGHHASYDRAIYHIKDSILKFQRARYSNYARPDLLRTASSNHLLR